MSALIEIPKNYVPRQHALSAEVYDSMIRNGILTENDNVELLNGTIIEKMPKGAKHSLVTNVVTKFFYRILGDSATIRVQDPVFLDDYSEPEPDIVLAKLPIVKYASGHPSPNDILLIVEVSDTALFFDRIEKGMAYSRAGIQQYIIVNVENDTLEDYRDPGEDGYKSKQTYHLDENLTLAAFPEVTVAVADFLRG